MSDLKNTDTPFSYKYNEDDGLVSIYANGEFITELVDENDDPEAMFHWFCNIYSKTNYALGYIEQPYYDPDFPFAHVFALTQGELNKAVEKFPTWPTDPIHALAVLGEEYGELNKEVLQLTYEPHKTNFRQFKTEAIQTAAMAIRFLASIHQYEFKQGLQHSQVASDEAE